MQKLQLYWTIFLLLEYKNSQIYVGTAKQTTNMQFVASPNNRWREVMITWKIMDVSEWILMKPSGAVGCHIKNNELIFFVAHWITIWIQDFVKGF